MTDEDWIAFGDIRTVVPAEQNPGLLTVTITSIGDNDVDPTGLLCGMICDTAGDATASANYQVKGATGGVSLSGSESSKADDTEPGLQLLADAIAKALAKPAQGAPSPSPAPSGNNGTAIGPGTPSPGK
jgi:hypothetical protein